MSIQNEPPYIISALGALEQSHEVYVNYLPKFFRDKWSEAPQRDLEIAGRISKRELTRRLNSAIERDAPSLGGVSVDTLMRYLEVLENVDLSREEDRQRLNEWYDQVRRN